MESLIAWVAIVATIYILAECLSLLFAGAGLIQEIARAIRRLLHHTREIQLPEDLRIAAANGLLKAGSELVAGTECEWSGSTISRFAVSPGLVQAEPGTIFKVVRVTRHTIELRLLEPQRGASDL